MPDARLREALILSAGLGTRLSPLTDVRAKPAVPVDGEPIVRHIVRRLVSQGLDRIVVNLHHRPDTITRILGDGSDLGAAVRYSWEQPHILGSAGGPRLAAPILGASGFVIVNGDTLTDLDVQALWQAHRGSGAQVTLALVPNREPGRYGGAIVDGDGVITGFVSKGRAGIESWHFIGVQAVDAAVFRDVVPGTAASTIGGLYDRMLVEQPGTIRAFRCEASFWDIGTVADYWRTSFALAGTGEQRRQPDALRTIAPSARVSKSILWDDVTVPAGCVVENCILTDGVVLPEGAQYRDSVVTRRGTTVEVVPFDAS
jgi:mannose-1-phosphate guanylyltransferase